LAFVGEKRIIATFATIDGIQKTGRVDYLRFDKVRIEMEESEGIDGGVDIGFVDVDWDKAGLESSDVNLLLLSDRLRDYYSNHLRLRKHLYPDRNQARGESELRRNSTQLVFLDYMMKLRAKMFKSDTSKFHLLMNKGSSVHVFAVKERLNTETLAGFSSEEQFSDARVEDYMMIWLDSFGTNTTQGGYETLCVQEASLRRLKTLRPHIDIIDFCSDAGSGYKSTQTILGLRRAKETTGIRVRRMHFNASVEGKRSETDGHNTDIKSRRESAMRAGEPAACVTPDAEVQASCIAAAFLYHILSSLILSITNKLKLGVGTEFCRFTTFSCTRMGIWNWSW
jgi:hypothetical protein